LSFIELMKNQFFGILFYLLYLLAMIRPLVPIIEYYSNYNYIANALCENRDRPYLECNGKCYLEKQLKKAGHENHEHKSTVPQINFDDYPISQLEQYSYQIKDFKELDFEKQFVEHQISQEYHTSLFKPPQVIS